MAGDVNAKLTSSNGFHIDIDVLSNFFEANGILTTTVDRVV